MAKNLSIINKEFGDVGSYADSKDELIASYDRHIDTVYRVCLSILGNKQDAEDISQAVFIKLMESDKTFVDTEHEKAWLIVTARNQCRDLQRRWWRKRVVDLDLSAVIHTDEEPLTAIVLQGKLRKLPAMHRLVLYLCYYEGYKQTEIAKMLGINLNTVKTRLRTAKKRLLLEIGDDFNE